MKTKIIVALLIFGILFISACSQIQQITKEDNKITASDFSIDEVTYAQEPLSNGIKLIPLSLNQEGTIYADILITISINKSPLYLRAYQNNEEIPFGSLEDSRCGANLCTGSDKFSSHIKLESLNDKPVIEICASEDIYDTPKDKRICKSKIIPSPNLELSISPDPINFILSKNINPMYIKQNLIIKNIGDIPTSFRLKLPERIEGEPIYDNYEQGLGYLDVGEIITIPIAPRLTANTDKGSYTNIGYVYALYDPLMQFSDSEKTAKYKKEFKLKTTVVE